MVPDKRRRIVMPNASVKGKRVRTAMESRLVNGTAISEDWQLQLHFIWQRASFIRTNGLWSDCSFVFETPNEKVIKAHKAFLAMSSPVFEKMFFGSVAERAFPIHLQDIDARDFQLFLEFIYTGKLELIAPDDAINVCYIAKKYMVPDLAQLCIDKMWDFLTPKTVCQIYEFATLIEDNDLKDQCLKVICLDTMEVIRDPNFLTIKKTTMEMILDMDNLNVSSELDLFNALCEWAKSECERSAEEGVLETLRSIVSTTLPKIRVLTLRPQEVAEGIACSNLLTSKESYAILINILSQSACEPLPSGFSTNTTKRMSIEGRRDWNNKYPCFKEVKLFQENSSGRWISKIHFQVTKKIKIVGAQTTQGTMPRFVDTGCHRSSQVFVTEAFCIMLETARGKPLSPCQFFDMKHFPGNIEIRGSEYLYRKREYVLRIVSFTNIVYHSEVVMYQDINFENAKVYTFGYVPNLPIQSIVYHEL